jgi:MFS family permease
MNQSLRLLNILNVFEGLVGSLIGIFVPIFLLSSGHSVKNVLVYYLVYSLFVFISFFIAAMVATKWNLTSVLILRYFFWFAYLMLLFFIPQASYLIYWLALASAISSAFYFLPFHIIFGQSVTDAKMGSQFGRIVLIGQIVGFCGPLIAAGVIKLFGYNALFLVAIIIMTGSLFFLKMLPKMKTKITFTWANWQKFARRNQSYFWFEFFENIIEEIEGIIFPIFIYITVYEIWSVAFVSVLASVGSLIFTWLVSKRIDGWKRTRVLLLASLMLSALWLSRYWLAGNWFYISSVLIGLLATVFSISFNAMVYVKAKQDNYDEFIIFRETPVFLARTCLYLLAIFMVNYLNIFFIIAASLYLVLMFILNLKRNGMK